MTNRQHTARAVGAALVQRATTADYRPELEVFRKQALAPPERDGLCVGEVIQALDAWIGDTSRAVRNADAPRGEPAAYIGAEIATMHGTGGGDTWRAGGGLEALAKCLGDDIASHTPGFTTPFHAGIAELVRLATTTKE